MLCESPPRWLDGVAEMASILCLIPGRVVPAVLLVLPVLATMLAVPASFRAFAFVRALPTSVLAMAPGHRRYGLWWPFIAAVIGLALLGIGAFAIESETVERAVSSVGAAVLAVAHVGNWRVRSHASSLRSRNRHARHSGRGGRPHFRFGADRLPRQRQDDRPRLSRALAGHGAPVVVYGVQHVFHPPDEHVAADLPA